MTAPQKKSHPWKRLKAARLARGLKQAEAAALVGISQGQWSAVEKGNKPPSKPVAILLRLFLAGKL